MKIVVTVEIDGEVSQVEDTVPEVLQDIVRTTVQLLASQHCTPALMALMGFRQNLKEAAEPHIVALRGGLGTELFNALHDDNSDVFLRELLSQLSHLPEA